MTSVWREKLGLFAASTGVRGVQAFIMSDKGHPLKDGRFLYTLESLPNLGSFQVSKPAHANKDTVPLCRASLHLELPHLHATFSQYRLIKRL
jgi:hypothetical protein